jgi:small GTP-binding protein
MAEFSKKVCLCGDSAVGKTSLIRKFVVGKYDEGYISTLGTVVSKKTVHTLDSSTATLMIWDISGQKEFKRIHASAFKNAGGGVAVCDVTRPETIDHLQVWIETMRNSAGRALPVVVFANKVDLVSKGSHEILKASELAKSLNCEFYVTSAKTGENVDEGFTKLANLITTTTKEERPWHKAVPDDGSPITSPTVFLDYIIDQFCEVFGDEDISMHIVRKQVKDNKINFEKPTVQDLNKLMDRFASLAGDFKGPAASATLKSKYIKARERMKF